jgi:hypothetical protein
MEHKFKVIPKEEILANRSNAYDFIDFDKQETLEEAAIKATNTPNLSWENEYAYNKFLEGAKWQKEQYTIEEQHIGHTIDELDKEYIKGFNEGSNYYIERMYSEGEVLEIIKKLYVEIGFQFTNEIKEWCSKQFKNK